MSIVIHNMIKTHCHILINRQIETALDIAQAREKCQEKSKYLVICKSINLNVNHFLIRLSLWMLK